MSVDRSYALNVTATIKDYEKKLGEVPGVTEKEARRAAMNLHRELVKGQRLASASAKKAAQEAANAWGAASEAASKRFGDSAGKLGQNAGKLAGFLDTIAPGAGEVARGFADVADAGEVAASASESFGVGLGSVLRVAAPVAVAVGVLVALYKSYQAELEEAERKQKQGADILKDVQTLTDKVSAAKRELASAVGGETAVLVKNTAVQQEWDRAAVAANETLAAKRRELGELLATERAYVAQGLVSHQAKVEELTASIAKNEAEQRRNKEIAREGAQAQMDAAEATRLRDEAEEQARRNTQRRQEQERKALEERRRALEEYNRLTQESADNAADAASSFAKLGAGNEEKRTAAIIQRLKAEERLAVLGAGDDVARDEIEQRFAIEDATRALQEQRKALAQIRDERLALAYTVSAQETAEADYRAASVEAERATQAQIEAIREEYAQRDAERQRSNQNQHVGAYGDMLGSISAIAATASEEMAAKDKKAALNAWKISQAAALAQAGVNTALAISNALAQPVPPPIAAALAIAAGLAGGAQIAAIAAADPPQLAHQGEARVGGSRPGPMEVDRRLRVDEAVVTVQGAEMLGRERIARANRGQDPYADMRGGSPAFTTYGHRAFGRFSRDVVRLTNPMRAAMTAGSSVGLRTRK